MTPEQARAAALKVLQGEKLCPRLPPQRQALGRALPSAAEELRCTDGAGFDEARRGLTELWRALAPDQLQQEEFGTPLLGAGCLEAAELLGLELPPKHIPLPNSRLPPRNINLTAFQRKLSRPRVLVPLANEAPARVFHTTQAVAGKQDTPFRDTALLVERFLGVGTARWAMEHPATGRSMMAALFIRAVLEQWPDKAARLVPEWSTWDEFPAIGFTGELDAEGLALPVEELEDKIRRFFSCHPKGHFFVPDTQWKQARQIVGKLAPPPKTSSWSRELQQAEQVQPFRGTLDLLVRLGIATTHCPDTQPFEKLRRAARQVPCWNGVVLDVAQTRELGFERVVSHDKGANERDTLNEADFLTEVYRGRLNGRTAPACVEGGPGSGKSIVLRRLCAHLGEVNPLLGPALRVEARRLIETGFSIARALHAPWLPLLEEQTCAQLVDLAHAPALRGGVWLIIDGLDEVRSEHRRRIRETVARWPGPCVLGARPLPNEVAGAPHVRISPLSGAQQKDLFELEGKPGHWDLLNASERSWEHDEYRPSDRRKEMIADLCSTPLGVSLLAMRPEAELGEQLDVPMVLRSSIGTLLERAEEAGRISTETRRSMFRQGLGVLGAAVWSMIRRGAAVLTFEDLAKLDGPERIVSAVQEVLDNSDLVQRVGSESYQFSHKSLAELCAAIYLQQKTGAEAELLTRVGEPGAEAVASHFGGLLGDPSRLTAFIRQLTDNPRRPFSSLALATRLLVANGPGRLDTEAALDVLIRRVRLASHRYESTSRVPLPGGLSDKGEMWLALGRWAQALRPHAEALVRVCPPAMIAFLRGKPPPPLRPPYVVGRKLSPALDFMERLALTLGMELPLVVFTRMQEGETVLMSRPEGPWLTELEALVTDGEDVHPGSGPTAASVWVQRVSEKRLLERLDVLSRHAPTVMAPLISTVVKLGSVEQKREALLRAVLNSLEFKEKDRERDWFVKASFVGKTTALSSEQWLSRWEQFWNCGLVGETPAPTKELESLYAEFIDDACGPARWRALIALHRIKSPGARKRLRMALRDEFRPVRLQALALLARRKAWFPPHRAWLSLVSLDSCERQAAFVTTGLSTSAPLDLLLAVLSGDRPPTREYSSTSPWLPTETPWERAVHRIGEEARATLIREVHQRLETYGYHAFAGLIDGPHGDVVEEIFPSLYERPPSPFFPTLLKTGSPRQRRFAARRIHSQRQWDELVSYTEDADPEVARLAIASRQEQQEARQRQARYTVQDRAERRVTDTYWNRPVLEVDALKRFASFESLWKALSEHQLPSSGKAQVEHERQRKLHESPFEDPSEPLEPLHAWVSKPFLQRLRQLYQPQHQALVLTSILDERLTSFSVPLLHEHLPPLSELLSLVSRGGRSLELAIDIAQGTPHAAALAQRIREDALADRLRPPSDPYQTMHESSVASGYAAQEVRRWVLYQLDQLDGVAALLSWLEPDTLDTFRKQTLEFIQGSFHARERNQHVPERPEVLAWARRAREQTADDELREIAFWIISIIGNGEDMARCRDLLNDPRLPPHALGFLLRFYGRLASPEDSPLFRSFLTHSLEASSEAAAALVRLGGEGMHEELLEWMEAPPPSIGYLSHFIHHRTGWPHLTAESIIRFGTAAQARRLARLMADDREVWRVAARYLRLPEHLLFIAGHLGTKDPGAEDDDGYDDAKAVFERMLRGVDATAARRVMIEASHWGDNFERSFEEFIQVHPEDADLILSALREQPDSALALEQLKALPDAEEHLHALWKEMGVPWW